VTARSRNEFVAAFDAHDVARAEVRSSLSYDMFLLNIVLQLFDGMATYSGIHMGALEANRLLRNAFVVWGVGPSLVLFKAFACGVLLLLYRNIDAEIGRPALTLLAALYCVFSLLPWMAKLTSLALALC
jgi:hypothetical protein